MTMGWKMPMMMKVTVAMMSPMLFMGVDVIVWVMLRYRSETMFLLST